MLHDVGIKLVPVSSIGEPGSIKISEQYNWTQSRDARAFRVWKAHNQAEYGAGLPVWTGSQHVNHKLPHWLESDRV